MSYICTLRCFEFISVDHSRRISIRMNCKSRGVMVSGDFLSYHTGRRVLCYEVLLVAQDNLKGPALCG